MPYRLGERPVHCESLRTLRSSPLLLYALDTLGGPIGAGGHQRRKLAFHFDTIARPDYASNLLHHETASIPYWEAT